VSCEAGKQFTVEVAEAFSFSGFLGGMKPNMGILDILTKGLLVCLLVALVLLLAQFYVPLFKQNQRYRELNLQLETAIQKEEAAGRRMEREITALQTDPEAIERRAREQLGFGKPDEFIIRFDPPQTNRTGN
jgi:cell division protein FtsB